MYVESNHLLMEINHFHYNYFSYSVSVRTELIYMVKYSNFGFDHHINGSNIIPANFHNSGWCKHEFDQLLATNISKNHVVMNMLTLCFHYALNIAL